MSDEIKLKEEVIRGSRAKEWLGNPLYEEAWEALRAKSLEALENLPLSDEAGRQEIHHMLSVMRKVKNHIKTVAETGTMARLQLNGTMIDKLKRKFA